MYMKYGVPYNIYDPLKEVTGNSLVTFADVAASDIYMDVLLDKDRRNTIKGFVEAPVMNDIAMKGLDLIMSEDEVIGLDNYETVLGVYRGITESLKCHRAIQSVTSYAVEFVMKESYSSSFTMIKIIAQDLNKEGEVYQAHYLLPLFSQDVVLSKNNPIVLHIDGEGNLEFLAPPMREGYEGQVLDTDKFVDMLMSTNGYSFYLMNLIQHTKLFCLPVGDFAVQYAKAINKSQEGNTYAEPSDFIPAQGLGIYIDIDGNTLYGDIEGNVYKDKFDIDTLNSTKGRYLLMYDNRTYTDKLMEGQPITIQVLSDTQIDYSGLYMDEDFVESGDARAVYAEANTATAVGRTVEKAKSIPKNIIEKADKLISKIREVAVEFRRADDDKLRERIINDEFVPILDNSLKYIIGGVTAYGLYFFGIANPLMAVLGGLGAKQLKQIRDKERREKALKMIKDELEILDEKINDAKSRDDRKEKYALMRIKQNLEGKLLGVTSKRKYVN